MDRDGQSWDRRSPAVTEGTLARPDAARKRTTRGRASEDWQGALAIFFLATCCLLPLFLVSLGAWFATLSPGFSGSLWLFIAGVAIAAIGLALWRRRRRRGCSTEEGS
jgi:LPXTG-motif cell wall-anchored protein